MAENPVGARPRGALDCARFWGIGGGQGRSADVWEIWPKKWRLRGGAREPRIAREWACDKTPTSTHDHMRKRECSMVVLTDENLTKQKNNITLI